mmetsp:Transcript_11713/g.28444  ORF Transcript_11713/g.28444 Transcript_11713/m.28444 type:complete len:325 (+) Transcript_11713:992-1966(+)
MHRSVRVCQLQNRHRNQRRDADSVLPSVHGRKRVYTSISGDACSAPRKAVLLALARPGQHTRNAAPVERVDDNNRGHARRVSGGGILLRPSSGKIGGGVRSQGVTVMGLYRQEDKSNRAGELGCEPQHEHHSLQPSSFRVQRVWHGYRPPGPRPYARLASLAVPPCDGREGELHVSGHLPRLFRPVLRRGGLVPVQERNELLLLRLESAGRGDHRPVLGAHRRPVFNFYRKRKGGLLAGVFGPAGSVHPVLVLAGRPRGDGRNPEHNRAAGVVAHNQVLYAAGQIPDPDEDDRADVRGSRSLRAAAGDNRLRIQCRFLGWILQP